jgi:5'-nucleotidase
MRILLTNDDGINARGLDLLETIAQRFSDDVWVVAPTEEQSGAGHSLTLTQPVRVRRHDNRRYSVTGTPTDAVMMALAYIMKDSPPDLILSGINRGANLAEDVTYSGTVSAAMEGALAGVPSIALSQSYSREGMGDTVPFAAAEAWAERALAPLVEVDLGPGTLINVNFPALPPEEVKGVRVCRQGIRDRSARLPLFLVRSRPRGGDSRPRDRPRGLGRRLCFGDAVASRPNARCIAGAAPRPLCRGSGFRVADFDHLVAFLARRQPNDSLVADPRSDQCARERSAPADTT